MKMIATKSFPYAGVPLKPGDMFDASDEDARMLKGWGKARNYAGAVTTVEYAVYPKRGTYKRRDMRATD